MSFIDEVNNVLADTGQQDRRSRWTRWARLCVCGHVEEYHGQAIGGTHGLAEEFNYVASPGCVGAIPDRDHPPARRDAAGRFEAAPTCPCPKFRPVAEIDRPGRYFRQKVWTKDLVHPMLRGLKAQHTRLSNSKAYGSCADEEVDRRLRWLPGARECRVCGRTGDGVWPAYVNEGRLSQMRCAEHRRLPRAEAP